MLGPQVELTAALALADGMRLSRPSTSVVLVRDEVDAMVMRDAMHAGIRDVVPLKDTDSIRAAVDRAYQLYVALRGPGGAMHQGRIVTVFSPKGGVGKTTVSVNLALALADKGARKVCLVDLDLAFGDVAITLQLFPSHTLEHAIGSEDSIDAPLLESLLTRHADSVMVLAAPSHPDVRERVSPDAGVADPQGAARVLRLHRRRHRAGLRRADPDRARRDRRVPDRGDPRRPHPQERQGGARDPGDARHRPRPPPPAAQPCRRRGRPRRRPGRVDPGHGDLRPPGLVDGDRRGHQRRPADHEREPPAPLEPGAARDRDPAHGRAGRTGSSSYSDGVGSHQSQQDKKSGLFRRKK